MKHISLVCAYLLSLFLYSCENTSELAVASEEYSYLALGDSYTIGESVDSTMRWPVQLADSLSQRGFPVSPPKIIATTGWTSDELMQGIIRANIQDTFDLVSLLIGVNNQYRGYDTAQYRFEFQELLYRSIEFAGGVTGQVFVVSIPDYGVTPFGQTKDPEKIARELDIYNDMARKMCTARGIAFYNITDISRKADENAELVASDDLHPSGKMYTQWVAHILAEVQAQLP